MKNKNVFDFLLPFSISHWVIFFFFHFWNSLVGVVKGVLTTFIGFFTFGGVPASVLTITGIVLNTFGSLLYTYGKYIENIEKQIHKHVHEQSVEIHEDHKVAINGHIVNKDNGSSNNPELKEIKVQSWYSSTTTGKNNRKYICTIDPLHNDVSYL